MVVVFAVVRMEAGVFELEAFKSNEHRGIGLLRIVEDLRAKHRAKIFSVAGPLQFGDNIFRPGVGHLIRR